MTRAHAPRQPPLPANPPALCSGHGVTYPLEEPTLDGHCECHPGFTGPFCGDVDPGPVRKMTAMTAILLCKPLSNGAELYGRTLGHGALGQPADVRALLVRVAPPQFTVL